MLFLFQLIKDFNASNPNFINNFVLNWPMQSEIIMEYANYLKITKKDNDIQQKLSEFQLSKDSGNTL